MRLRNTPRNKDNYFVDSSAKIWIIEDSSKMKQQRDSIPLSQRRRSKFSFKGLVIPLFILVLLSAKSYLNDIILPSASDPTDSYDVKTGILTVNSEYKRPIIIATIRGHLNEDGCTTHAEYNKSTLKDVATVTILSENEPGGTFYQFGTVNRTWSLKMWETNFHLNISPPPTFDEGDVCYEVYWRVEYVDYARSVSDFPSRSSSFRGTPTFRRPWKWADFNANNGTNADWLVRKHHDERWAWSGQFQGDILKDGTESCPESLQERDYTLAIIGDSQPYYMCQHLIRELQSSNNVRCVQIKHTLANETAFLAYANALQDATEDVVIFNPSGLWEAAYGSIDLFRDNFQRLLGHIPSGRKHRQSFFFAPTSAVHPIVYLDLANDEKKWSMTQVRVREINTIAKQLVIDEAQKRAGDSVSLKVLPTPIDALTLNREDDPKSPTDMRHFGDNTNEMLLQAIQCDLLD